MLRELYCAAITIYSSQGLSAAFGRYFILEGEWRVSAGYCG